MTDLNPRLALLILLLALVSHWAAYQHGQSVERAVASQATAQRDSGDRLAEVIGERDARREEQRRATAQEEARAYAQEERTIADSGAADADAAGQRLRSDAAKLASTVSCPGTDPPSIARGKAASRAALVLSELLDRSVETNRELAAALDRARISGRQCEQEYDALNKS